MTKRRLFLALLAWLPAVSSAWGLSSPPDVPVPASLAREAFLHPDDAWQPDLRDAEGLPREAPGDDLFKAEEGRARRDLARGIRLLREGNAAGAEEVLADLLAGGGGDPATSYWLGEARLARGGWREAKADFEASLDGPLSRPARSALAWMAYREEDHPRALGLLKVILEGPAADASAAELDLAAACSLRTGDASRAAVLLQRRLEKHPGAPGRDASTFLMAEARYLEGSFSQAAALFRDLAARRPERAADALWGAGWSALRAGELRAGAADLQALAARHPEDRRGGEALLLAARALAEAGDTGAALPLFERAAGLGAVPRAPLYEGLAQLSAGRPGEAAAAFRRAAGTEGALKPLALYLEGDAWLAAGDLTRAASAWRSAVGLRGADDLEAAALLKAGWALDRAGDLPGAAAVLRSLVLGQPESPVRPEAVFLLAGTYARGGNASQAAFLYRDLLESAGRRGTDARFGLGEALFSLGRWEEAVPALEVFLARDAADTRSVRARFLLGESLHQVGREEESAAAFRAVLSAGPGIPEREVSLYRAGSLSFAAGDFREAADPLGRLAGEFPKSGFLAEASWMRGASLASLGDEAGAQAAWDVARRTSPGSAWDGLALLGTGEIRLKEGRFAEASAALAEAGRILDAAGRPEEGLRAARMALEALEQAGDLAAYRREAAAFRGARPVDPLVPESLWKEACWERRAGNDADGLALLRRLVRDWPGHSLAGRAWVELGRAAAATGNWEEAVTALERAALAVPEDEALRLELGRALEHAGRLLAAEDAYAALAAAGRPPAALEAGWRRARLLAGRGSRSLALEVLEVVLAGGEGFPGAAEAALLAGELESEAGDEAAALARFQRAAAGAGEPAAAGQLRVAGWWRRAGQADRAIIEYLKVPILHPDRVREGLEARLEAAVLHLAGGRKDDAAALLREVAAHPDAGELGSRASSLLGEPTPPPEPAEAPTPEAGAPPAEKPEEGVPSPPAEEREVPVEAAPPHPPEAGESPAEP